MIKEQTVKPESTNIHVIDSMMGTGKSSTLIDKMNVDVENKYIYITPFLDEIERIKKTVTSRRFRDPQNRGEGKLDSLHKLLVKDCDIASTHVLFTMVTEETLSLIQASDYILVLDEVLNVIEPIPFSKKDFDILLNQEMVKVLGNNRVVWTDDSYDNGRFLYFKQLCSHGTVIKVKDKLFMWAFPIEIFKAFKEVYILTYLFEGQIMKYYFDMHKINYDKFVIEDYEVVKWEDRKPYDKNQLIQLMNIYEGNLNSICTKETDLSVSWFKNSNKKQLHIKLKNNVSNYFKHILKAKSDTVLWTTFKDARTKLKGRGYTKGFLSCNSRATNQYQDRYNLAYCCNRYLNPDIQLYFNIFGIQVNEDLWSLSELLQWIWRSRIRNNEPINLYIPSDRTRGLLYRYLGSKL